ncbi:BlaI/MecI/CopY family transcriptional regulator [Streptomyces sp. NPDC101490]|uniref:BlaI/MecI/CopY family transcriptional regulator n=1 Tax=Streptomyces sp. NPDC101490 TaxID=3366143 RepID=UPI0038198DAE
MAGKRGDERRPHGELVAEVLAVLWESGEPMTAQEVNDALDRELARTTTATILSRLFEKGTLRRVAAGRGYAYQPVEDSAGLVADRMRRELEKDPQRDLVLKRFVSSLSASDEETLRRLLGEAEAEAASEGEVASGAAAGPAAVTEVGSETGTGSEAGQQTETKTEAETEGDSV